METIKTLKSELEAAQIENTKLLAKNAELKKDKEFYQNALKKVAEACGVTTPLLLVAEAENNEETYADLLVKFIKKYGVTAIDAARKEQGL